MMSIVVTWGSCMDMAIGSTVAMSEGYMAVGVMCDE
jgi:hypothetical protein